MIPGLFFRWLTSSSNQECLIGRFDWEHSIIAVIQPIVILKKQGSMKHSQRSEAITISLQPIRPAMLAWHTFLECILRIHETKKGLSRGVFGKLFRDRHFPELSHFWDIPIGLILPSFVWIPDKKSVDCFQNNQISPQVRLLKTFLGASWILLSSVTGIRGGSNLFYIPTHSSHTLKPPLIHLSGDTLSRV